MADVVADVIDIGQSEYHEVIAHAIVAHGAGGGGAGFFMAGFAMNDGGVAGLGVLADALPDAHDIATGGVHHHAAASGNELHESCLGAEGGDNDDVIGGHGGDHGLMLGVGDADHAHFGELAVDLLIVDDLPEEKDAAVSEDFASGVGEVDGALDAVAEAKIAREAHGGGTDLDHAAFGTNLLNDEAAVVGFHLSLHTLHHLRGANIHTTGGGSGCRHGSRKGEGD